MKGIRVLSVILGWGAALLVGCGVWVGGDDPMPATPVQKAETTPTTPPTPIETRFRLTLIPSGSGEGIIVSSPAGIHCGTDCTELYLSDLSVTLTATASLNSTFTGWSAPECTGTGDCTIRMNEERVITATFSSIPFAFNIAASPATLSVPQGTSATSTITVTSTAGAAQPVHLSTNDCPANMVCSFSPASLTPTATSVFNMTTTLTTPPGTYTMTIMATDGTATTTTTLVVTVVDVRGIVDTAGHHNCKLASTGEVYCWGRNKSGQLGNGQFTPSSLPTLVNSITNAALLGGGHYHTCSILADKTVQCWGKNNSGQLGDGSKTDSAIPVPVSDLSGVTFLEGGELHTCALLLDKTVKCWGSNASGQRGHGSTTATSTPSLVSHITNVISLSSGLEHSCAVLSGGEIWCWGNNKYGQLGDNTTKNRDQPVLVSGITTATAVGGGGGNLGMPAHTCALLADQTVQCWGDNSSGQLGDGSNTSTSIPVTVSHLNNAVSVAVGGLHTCIVAIDNTLWCWGNNTYGQLGNGTKTASNIPVLVRNQDGTPFGNVITVGVGHHHTCAVRADNTTWCWGQNGSSELGFIGKNSLFPIQVQGLP